LPRKTVLGPTIVSKDSTVGSKKRIAGFFFLAMGIVILIQLEKLR
jgi:hypothetical protein